MIDNTAGQIRIFGLILFVVMSLTATSEAARYPEKMLDKDMTEMHIQDDTNKSHDMKQTMQAGMEAMASMETTGDTDKDFAMMMKVHHQQALDMAKMELAHGKSPTMKAMAKRIISAQKKEIAQFDSWLAKQK